VDKSNELKKALSEKERLLKAGFCQRMGFGLRPAVVCIDCQVYMVGDREESMEESAKKFPSSCGEKGWRSLRHIARLNEVARECDVPIFYTVWTVTADGRDAGVYSKKRKIVQSDNWAIEGSTGAQISPLVQPEGKDIIIPKKKPSAFFGTTLLPMLIERSIDTLLVTGGSTSNCVRATVFDAASYNFRPMVVSECVFDRVDISHEINLFDMDRQFADVVSLQETVNYLRAL